MGDPRSDSNGNDEEAYLIIDGDGGADGNGDAITPERVGLMTSLHQESREVRYGRLCTLIVKAGTLWLREYTLRHLPAGVSLTRVLHEPHVAAELLRLRKRRVIQPGQYQQLYPDGGATVQDRNLDMTVWVILARNVTITRGQINWDATPAEGDDLPQHHILRLRNIRNELHHVAEYALTETHFCELWEAAAASLRRLGCPQAEIDQYRVRDLDPETTRHWVSRLTTQALEDTVTQLQAEVLVKQHWSWGLLGLLCLSLVSFCVIITVLKVTDAEYIDTRSCRGKPQNVHTPRTILQNMSRWAWGAQDPRGPQAPFVRPVDTVIITHTATNQQANTEDEYCHMMQQVQMVNFNTGFDDIVFSYVVGNNGVVYEGEGARYRNCITRGINNRTVSVAFLGTFTHSAPSKSALNTGRQLIQYLVDRGDLTNKTTVLGLCQVNRKFPIAPGAAFMDVIMGWHGDGWTWKDTNLSQCADVSPTTPFPSVLRWGPIDPGEEWGKPDREE